MKSKALIAIIAVVSFSLMMAVGGCRIGHRTQKQETAKSGESDSATSAAANQPQAELSINAGNDDGIDLPEKEEIRRKFQMTPNSLVNVYGINGKLTVETADSDTAEVLIIRSARTREDLASYRKVRIEQNENNLEIGIESDRKSIFSAFGRIPEGRQRVILKIPRRVDFEANRIGGDVIVGEITGRVELRGINGQIKASRIEGTTDVSGVNGGVDLTFAPLTGKGIEIGGVNGNIDLRFEGEVNADLTSWSVNGRLNPDLPNVEKQDEESRRSRSKTRIGTGGTQIEIRGINGNVNLLKAGKINASSAKAAAK